MPALTRRRSNDSHAESWLIFYGDVQVGTIKTRAAQRSNSSARSRYSGIIFTMC
jgi:hypothetical protein